jgi:ABC-type transport system involved in multi-copper enzyme maturation permease subunit
MSTKAITTEQKEERTTSGEQQPIEAAPSVMRADELNLPRNVGILGAGLIFFGALSLLLYYSWGATRISPPWAMFSLAVGVVGLLYHAAFDNDLSIRRVYMGFGVLALIIGAFMCFVPYPNQMGDQFRLGYLLMTLALFFLLAFLRNETDPFVRFVIERMLGGTGAVMAAVGLVGGSIKVDFLLSYGLLVALLGLVYLTAFVGVRGTGNDLGYRAGLGMGLAGLLVFLVALGRSALPPLFHQWGWISNKPAEYLIPQGMLLMFLGLTYVAVSFGICSDNTLIVLTRRELSAFFFSPVAYFILIGFVIIAWFNFSGIFISQLLEKSRGPIEEPIVSAYIFSWIPAIGMILAVPFLTMRLLSEEHRSGTIEVLFTGPVGDTPVVLSKFLAAFLMYLAAWTPFFLFLVALYLGTGTPFDYRPILSFALAVSITGAAFVSMGLFFSSLTRNQVVSGVLSFMGMTFLFLIAIVAMTLKRRDSEGAWTTPMLHVSYLEIWDSSLEGKFHPNLALFWISLTILFLFLTVKIVESRKWR